MNAKHGDFSGLADNYSRYRPDYSRSVLSGLLGYIEKPVHELDFVDIGAGTGIWTRMVAQRGPKSAIAIEPNNDMRNRGISDSVDYKIEWTAGSAEKTGLATDSADLVTMASSFHWVDFETGTKEFYRILRPSGVFCALWNPRSLSNSPLLMEIESYLHKLKPDIERVSSGNSSFTAQLTERLEASPYFEDVLYLEGRHSIDFTKDQYLGVWNSVNDVRVQLGERKFRQFIDFVKDRLSDINIISADYLTRAWAARVAK